MDTERPLPLAQVDDRAICTATTRRLLDGNNNDGIAILRAPREINTLRYLSLSAAENQRRHQVAAESFMQRVLSGQLVQPGHQLHGLPQVQACLRSDSPTCTRYPPGPGS